MTIFEALFAATTVAGAATSVWLAIRTVREGRRAEAAVAGRLAAEQEAENERQARVAAETIRDGALQAKDDAKKDLARCREAREALYEKLRAAGAAGAGDSIDDSIRRLYPDADDPG